MIRLADYVMRRISDEGIKHVFYVPGRQCFFLTDAMRRNENIDGIGMHHEQAVAMAALSYSVYNNHLGAALVTTGCAGTNALTGVLHAWQDSIPMIVISGQQEYAQTIKASGLPLRQVGVQEADIETLVKPITKYSITITDPNSIAYHMDKALGLAMSGRKGPVWVDIPFDIQNTMIDEEKLERFVFEDDILTPDEEDIEYVKNELEKAERPVVFVGNGIRSSDAVDELTALAENKGIPLVFTRLSYDLIPYDHQCNYGIFCVGAGGARYSHFIIQNSDLILAIGTRLSIDTIGGVPEQFGRKAKLIVVDIDDIEHSKETGPKIDRFIHSDARQFLKKLNQISLSVKINDWIKKCNHWKDIFDYPYNDRSGKDGLDFKIVMRHISETINKRAAYVSDAGTTGAGAPITAVIRKGDRFIHSFAQGEMGYALPGACGVAAIHEGCVIAYTGDGSVMMNIQELQTIVRNSFNIKVIIINNNGYAGVRHGQNAYFRGKTIGTDPSNGLDFPSFKKISEAFGTKYICIDKYDDMDLKIKQLFEDDLPSVCEVICDPDQTDYRTGTVICGKRKVSVRPPEDLFPYIDRDLFFKEMIVEPMEESSGRPL